MTIYANTADAALTQTPPMNRRTLLGVALCPALLGCAVQGTANYKTNPGNPRRFGSVVRRFKHKQTLVNFAISVAADRVVGLALFDRDIYVWRLSDGELVNRTPAQHVLRSPVVFIDGGRRFVSPPTLYDPSEAVPTLVPRQSCAFSVFDSQTGRAIRNIPAWQRERLPRNLDANPDRALVAVEKSSLSATDLQGSPDGKVLVGLFQTGAYPFMTVFDTETFARLQTIYFDQTTQTANNHIAVAPDGRSVVVAGETHRWDQPQPTGQDYINELREFLFKISVVSLSDGSLLSRTKPIPTNFLSISLSPDGSKALTTNQYYFVPRQLPGAGGGLNDLATLRVTSLGGDHAFQRNRIGSTKSLPSADWSGDGSLIVAGGTNDGHVALLDAESLALLDTCRADQCGRVRFVEGRSQVAYIDDDEVVLREVVRGS